MSQRRMGLIGATALVVGNMIGSGVFVLPATLAPFGVASLLGWAASLLGALALAYVYADLARTRPAHGGAYAYARASFGDFIGFVVAWSYWICLWCGNAAIAVAFAGSVSALSPTLAAHPAWGAALALSALWICTLTNAIGMREASVVQVVTTLIKLIPLALMALFGWWFVTPANFHAINPQEQNLLSVTTACAALTLWAFLGLESATIPAHAIDQPERTIPRATLLGVAIAGVVTVLACTAVLGLLPAAQLQHSAAPMADAARVMGGPILGTLIAVIAAVSSFGALNGWVMLQAQMPQAAANDSLFPKPFALTNRSAVPWFGLILSSALGSVLVIANFQSSLVKLFEFSILLATASALLPYGIASAAWLVDQWRNETRVSKQSTNGKRSAVSWMIATVALLFSIWALIGTGKEALLWGAGLVLAGLPLYWWQRRSLG